MRESERESMRSGEGEREKVCVCMYYIYLISNPFFSFDFWGTYSRRVFVDGGLFGFFGLLDFGLVREREISELCYISFFFFSSRGLEGGKDLYISSSL